VFTLTILEVCIREVRFFERVSADVPVRVPECHHAVVNPETSRFVGDGGPERPTTSIWQASTDISACSASAGASSSTLRSRLIYF